MGIKLSCSYGKITSTSVAVGRLSKPDYIAVRVLCLTEMTSLTDQLDNGPVPADPEKVFFFLEKHGLSSTTRDHPPMFTVTDSQALRPSGVNGGYTKNFFLRNKKRLCGSSPVMKINLLICATSAQHLALDDYLSPRQND